MKSTIITTLIAVIGICAASGLHAQWSADVLISTSDTSAALNENMGRCIAAAGDTVHIVWWDATPGATGIYYRHSFDGGLTWASPQIITSFTKPVDFSSVAVSGAFVHVVFRSSSDSLSYYMRSTNAGNSWSQPVSLGRYYFWPSVAASGSNVFVGLNSKPADNSEVWCRRSTDNGVTWGPAFQISNAAGRSEDQTIAATDGYVYMGWNDNRTGKMQTWFRRSSDNGTTWEPETQLTQSTSSTYFPILDAQGTNCDYAGGDQPTGNFEVYFKHSSDHGATWSATKQVSHSGGLSAYPVLSRVGTDVHLVYWVFNGAMYYAHTSDNGTTWDTLELVSAGRGPNRSFISATSKALHVIWTDKSSGHPEVYYKRFAMSVVHTTEFQVINSLDFGDVHLGASTSYTVKMYNEGNSAVNISKYVLSDSANYFSLTDTLAHTIAGGDSATLVIHFTPQKEVDYSATMSIVTDEGVSNIHPIQLNGRGVASHLSGPSTIDFGMLEVGASKDTTIALHNSGMAPLNISEYFLNDAQHVFALTDTTLHIIAPGADGTVAVRFSPSAELAYQGALAIGSDESGVKFPPIKLKGKGLQTKLSLDNLTLDFGNVDSASSKILTTSVSNIGTLAVSIDSFVITGSQEFSVVSPNTPLSVASADSAIISVKFAPIVSGAVSAVLKVYTSIGPLQIELKGTGIGKKDTTTSAVREAASPLDLIYSVPNPSNGAASLHFVIHSHLEDVKLSFFDATGCEIETQFVGILDEGLANISLTLPHSSGLIFIRVSSEGRIVGSAQMILTR